jgi:hypothetical protein
MKRHNPEVIKGFASVTGRNSLAEIEVWKRRGLQNSKEIASGAAEGCR